MKHLFLAIPNNCGSTLLYHALGRCAQAKRLPGRCGEGQDYFNAHGKLRHFKRTLGPHPLRTNSLRLFTKEEGLYTDPTRYDWLRIKSAWAKAWGVVTPVLVEKSPANVARWRMMQIEFPGSYWIFGIRNPYAMIEGILRRNPAIYPIDAAKHWLRCAQLLMDAIDQRDWTYHTWVTYELMTDAPDIAQQLIVKILPELEDLNLTTNNETPNIANTTSLVNLNDQQIARLTQQQLDKINSILSRDEPASVMRSWNYKAIETEGAACGCS